MSVCGLSPAHPLFLCHSLRGSHLREFLVFFFRNWRKKCMLFFLRLWRFLRPGAMLKTRQEIPSHPVMEFYSRSIFIIVRHFQLAIQIYHHSLCHSLPLSIFYFYGLLLIEFFTNWHLFVPRNIVMLQSRFRRITRSSSAPSCNPPCTVRCWQITGPAKVFLSFFLSLFLYCSLTRWSSYPTLSPFEFWTPINCLHSRVSSQIGAKAKNVFDKLFGQNWQLSRRLWKMFIMNTIYL